MIETLLENFLPAIIQFENIYPGLFLILNLSIIHFTLDMRVSKKRAAVYYLGSAVLWYIIQYSCDIILGQRIALFYLFYIPIYLIYETYLFQSLFLVLSLVNAYSSFFVIASLICQTFFEYGTILHNAVYIIISLIFLGIFAYFSIRYLRPLSKKIAAATPKKMWILYSLGQIIGFLALYRVSFEPIRIVPLYFEHPLEQLLTVLLVDWNFIMLITGIVITYRNAVRKYELQLAQQTISSGKEYYENLTNSVETLRHLRHDFKYHIAAIHSLVKGENRQEAEDYLQKLDLDLVNAELANYCENQVVNALIVYYVELFNKDNINHTVHAYLTKDCGINNYEMCVVVGNLLQNALEACNKMNDSKKYVQLTIKCSKNQVIVKVFNSYNIAPYRDEAGSFISTKENGGFGIKSIKTVVDKHSGEYITELSNNEFISIVMLNI